MSDRAKLLAAILAMPPMVGLKPIPPWQIERAIAPTNPRKAAKRAKVKAARKQKHRSRR